MSVIVRSFCTNDGGLIIAKDKSLLMNMITDIHGPVEEPKDLPTIRFNVLKVIIFDMMAILQSMKKTASMKFLKDLLRAICQKLENMSAGCWMICCMFDEYKDEDLEALLPSIK